MEEEVKKRWKKRWKRSTSTNIYVEEDTGIFLTKVDVFFQAKDNTMPVKFEIAETNQ